MQQVIQKVVSILLVFALMNVHGFANINVFHVSENCAIENEFANFSEDEFYEEFDELSALETHLSLADVSYAELVEAGSALVANVSPEPLMPFSDDGGAESSALGIPSFLWGCVLGWVGLLIVYLVTENRAETKKALWGCVVSTAVLVVYYGVKFFRPITIY